MEPYKYQPLDNRASFRLLTLKASKPDDPIVCTLKNHQLYPLFRTFGCAVPDTPRYHAISYVWGSDYPNHPIECDGQVFMVTESLHHALGCLRSAVSDVIVWADAMCINQADLRERKMQVALMREIYKAADCVTISIRASHSGIPANKASTLARILLHVDLSRPNPWSYVPDASSSFWSSLASFFDNPWFSRIWVIQEVAQSRRAHVLFGTHLVPWENIVHVAKWLLQSPDFGIYVLPNSKTRGVRNVLFMNDRTALRALDPIPKLLQSTRDFKATDPRDKVYAMLHTPIRRARTYARFHFLDGWKYREVLMQGAALGYLLTTTLETSPAEPHFWFMSALLACLAYHLHFMDSTRAVVWDFLQRFVAFCLLADRVVLHHLQKDDTLSDTLSIAADYSLTTQTLYRIIATRMINHSGNLNILSYVQGSNALDTTYPSWVPRWDVETQDLQVLVGLSRHRYQAAAGTCHRPNSQAQTMDYLAVEGLPFSQVTEVSDVIGKRTLRSAMRLRGCSSGDNWSYPTGEHMRKVVTATLTAGRFIPDLDSKSNSPFAAGKLPSYGRRQFATANGYMGIGPPTMRPGDLVCVLFGGCVPYVLRATETDGMYRLVGESFCHGIMRGEAVNMWKNGLIRKVKFTLC